MNMKKLTEQLDGILDYTRDNIGCDYADDVWAEDERALLQAMEMVKMLYSLFENFKGKGELQEYIDLLTEKGYSKEIIEMLTE